MKLLVVAQVIDTEDPVLGFFHEWVKQLASRFESVEIICLKQGTCVLPENVRVHSLGKERGRPRLGSISYMWRFLKLVWKLRHEYAVIFVHMNQEYVLLSGWWWCLLGKHVYLWRNHFAGSWVTDLAVFFCTKVFCTSRHSYTARFKKTIIMPVGVDIERIGVSTTRKKNSILFLARIAPSKRVEVFIEALRILTGENKTFTASIVGSPLPEHESYYESLKAAALDLTKSGNLVFSPGISHAEALNTFGRYDICVNTSPSGMFDKTIFEAAACGSHSVAQSADWRGLAGDAYWFDGTPDDLATRLSTLLAGDTSSEALRSIVAKHSLPALIDALVPMLR